MKLYIKQKVFSWGDKFTVKDEFGNDKYIVEGEIFTWGVVLNKKCSLVHSQLSTAVSKCAKEGKVYREG